MSDNGHFVQTPMQEMIGRAVPLSSQVIGRLYTQISVDWTQTDYAWWAKFRRGKQPGYEIGGLFASPIASIAADWTLGKGVLPTTGHAYTDGVLTDWVEEHLVDLIDWDYDASTLGDAYLGINPDGSLERIAPDLVTPIPNPANFRDIWGYTITTRPSESVTIEDTYLLQPMGEFKSAGRHLKITQAGKPPVIEDYPLLTDELPIIPYHSGTEANEPLGHPMYEALRKLFAEYDDVTTKSVDGVKAMGHPVPVMEGAEDPDAEIKNNATGSTQLRNEDGTVQTVSVIDLAKIFMLVLGKGASFKFASPNAFTEDAGRMLEYLFLLMLQHSRIPEWAWGGAVASSKASVDSQMPAFERFIEGRQRRVARPIKHLLRVWIKTMALTDRRLRAALPLKIGYPAINPRSEDTDLKWIELGRKERAVTRETLLKVANLPGIDDPGLEVAAAQQEGLDQQAAEEAAIQAEIARMASQREGAANAVA